MFSYEERMRAVMLFIESNCSENIVIRELGYPSPVALRNWYKEYLETGTLHEKSPSKPHYTQQQKENAVEYYATHETTLTQACIALGYPTRSVLRRWIPELQPDLLQTKYCQQVVKRVKWTKEQKLAVVEEMIANKLPTYTVAAKYGVSEAAISLWKKQLVGKDVSSSMKRKEVPKSPKSQDISVEDLKSQIAELEAQISDLKMELDAIETVARLRKKAEGINLTTLTNSEKADAIDALRSQYRLKQLLPLFQMSKSSYCYHAKRKTEPDKYCDLRIHIREIFESAYNSYGYRRIHVALQKMGIIVSEKVIRRIMKEEGLCVP